MTRSLFFAVLALIVASVFPFAPSAAQDVVTSNGTTISFGGGAARLDLPSVQFTGRSEISNGDTVRRFNDSELDEYGTGVTGEIATPLGGGLMGAVRGFYGEVDSKDRTRCFASDSRLCSFSGLVEEPGALSKGFALGDLTTRAKRDADHWGAAFELTRETSWLPFNTLFKSRKVGIGFDVRGLDQDLELFGQDSAIAANSFSYGEKLEARYYGATVSAGGEYSLSSLFGGGFGGLKERFGLRSFVTAHAGIYGVDVDYRGALSSALLGDRSLSLSDDDVAFIGGIRRETRKQLGPRASLSLISEFEYYSFVPKMQYKDNDAALGLGGFNSSTFIDDDDAFAGRTSLRLTIGLGDRQLYAPSPEPYK